MLMYYKNAELYESNDFIPVVSSCLYILSQAGETDLSSPCTHTAHVDGQTHISFINDGEDSLLKVIYRNECVLKIQLRSRFDFDVLRFIEGEWRITLLTQHPTYANRLDDGGLL